jgi:membrane fusion protein, multidrug efflux system
VQFKEGDLIKAGAPLYRIEKGLFQAQVEQAEGASSGAKPRKWHDVVVALFRD